MKAFHRINIIASTQSKYNRKSISSLSLSSRSSTDSNLANYQQNFYLIQMNKYSLLFKCAAVGAGIYLGYKLYSTFSPNRGKVGSFNNANSNILIPALVPTEFKAFKILSNTPINHNTNKIRFELPEDSNSLGLTVASCLVAKFHDAKADKDIIRPYTPITTEAESMKNHYFELMIKKYQNGPMSEHICSLNPGDSVQLKGPILKIDMNTIKSKNDIGMIAGGTGLTPMLQVIHFLLSNPKDPKKIKLIFGNVEERDILVREELDKLAKEFPNRLKIFYTLDKPSSNWLFGKGRVTEQMIKEQLPPPGPETLIMVCGPDGMLGHIAGLKNPDRSQGPLGGLLKNLGYTEDQVFKF